MKKHLKLIVLLLSCVIALSLLSGCGETPDTGWKPTGETITLIDKNPTDYLVVFAAGDDDAHTAALDFKDLVAEEGLKTASVVVMTDVASPSDFEILFGAADRQVSRDALALLTEKAATSPDDLHCVFHYADGKLAIVANGPRAYEMAIDVFMDTYYSGDKIAFLDTLKEHATSTNDDYDDYKLEKILSDNEDTKAEHEETLPELLAKLESQRNDIAATGAFGTSTKNIGTSSWGKPAANPIDEHPRLLLNSETLPEVKRALTHIDGTNDRLFTMFDTDITSECILPPPSDKGTNTTVDKDNEHNFNDTYLEKIQAKALAYLLYEDPYYGYQAIYYLKNYINTLDIVQIASDQCRQYGSVMYTAAIVYDWCYDLLTDVDKEQIIAGVENRLCRGSNKAGAKMEVGFPPSKQGSVSGHGSERQILRDYLAFATAIYGDNNSWWEYVAARVYNDYVPVRNYYYQSGITQQGTGYMKGRYISDLFSAWILKAATGKSPYVGQATVTRSILGYELAPGKLFNDGDDTGDYAPASGFLHTVYITAYVEGDSTLLAQAIHLKGNSVFTDNFNYMTSVAYAALRGMSDVEPAGDRYEDMELIQYNGSPLGQYIIREAWNTTDSAAVMMRIKERTTANHEHEDTGTFEIYYKGALTTDGGVYNNYGHEHTQYFHNATISHNGLIIYNPAKSSELNGWYSGGQRRVGEASNLNSLMSTTYDSGVVTGRQHGYVNGDKTKPEYAYIAGDITKAYPSDDVSYAGRRMLSVYTGDEEFPLAFFVYDDLSSTSKTYTKTFLLQISSKNAPTINEEDQTVITENGEGRLILTCLSEDVSITGVGGRSEGAYKADKSQNYMINGKQLKPKSNSADDGHWGRVEITYTKSEKNATFLNVITVTDAGNKKAPKINGTRSNNGIEGAVFDKKIVVLFATDRNRETEEISCTVSGSSSMKYYVSGVAAGKWTVSVDGKSVGTFEATEDGGLLTFEASGGKITITPAK